MKHGVTKMKNTKILILTLSALSLGLSGCANVPPDAGQSPEDPYEAFNRNMHAFNVMVDDAALKPVTKGYRWVTPQFVQDGVSNAIDNLGEVNNTLNNVLQGKGVDAVYFPFHKANQFLGMSGLPTFLCVDVMKRPQPEVDAARYEQHLTDVFLR